LSQIEQALEDIIQLVPETKTYISENLDELIEDNLIFEMKTIAKASNLPLEFIEGIAWIRTGELSGRVVNTWGTEEKPLAKWFNDGTPDHWVAPLTEDGVLVFEATFGRNASAIFFMGNAEEGDVIFSKGHFVSGLEKTEAWERGAAIGWKRFKMVVIKNSRPEVSKELETIG